MHIKMGLSNYNFCYAIKIHAIYFPGTRFVYEKRKQNSADVIEDTLQTFKILRIVPIMNTY